MFLTELNHAGSGALSQYYNRDQQLLRGLQEIGAGDRDTDPVRKKYVDWGAWWDADRLDPSGLNLRKAVIMLDGRATGEVSLAQICTPANKERVN